jgi:PUA domain protein
MSSKEIRSIRDSLEPILAPSQLDLLLVPPLDTASYNNIDLILSGGNAVLFRPEESYFPTLRSWLVTPIERRYLKVDSGAVPFVVNGADIMSPGVVGVDGDLAKNDLCVVTEERHNKPLSVSRMLVDASEVDRSSRGKVAKNLHHVGDILWKLNQE